MSDLTREQGMMLQKLPTHITRNRSEQDLSSGPFRPSNAYREQHFRNTRIIEFAQAYPGTLGRAIRLKRVAKQWSMPRLAGKIGVSRQHLWEVETGYGGNFTMIHAMPKLIDVLGLTLADLEAQLAPMFEEEVAA